MADETAAAGAERALEPMNAPWLGFDLEDEIGRLWREDASRVGRNAKTLVKHPDFRVVLTILKAHGRIQQHKARGRISIQTIRGHIRLHVSKADAMETIQLPAGHLLVLDRGLPHDVEAVVDSAFLLTIAWPEGRSGELTTARSSTTWREVQKLLHGVIRCHVSALDDSTRERPKSGGTEGMHSPRQRSVISGSPQEGQAGPQGG